MLLGLLVAQGCGIDGDVAEFVIPLGNAKKYMKKNALERYVQVPHTKTAAFCA